MEQSAFCASPSPLIKHCVEKSRDINDVCMVEGNGRKKMDRVLASREVTERLSTFESIHEASM